MEIGPQGLIDVELRDEVVVLDISRVTNHKINVVDNWWIDEERNEFLCKGVETRGRTGNWTPWLELRRRTQDTKIWTRGRWMYMVIVICSVLLCFRSWRANWSVMVCGFLELGGRRHGPTPSEKETQKDLLRSRGIGEPASIHPF